MSAPPVSNELRTGALLAGKYRLDRMLGRGAMGSVYLAEQLGLGRKVAVKFLDLPVTDGRDEVLERFKREGQVSATIGHPGVVEVLDAGNTDEGAAWLVMEYLQGPTLLQFLKGRGALEPAIASAIVGPMLETLAAAHARGILHRDLKPANTMLAISPVRRVKLLDFGISKFLGSVTRITRTGGIMGTPQYMSPEQTLGKKDIGVATDLYSVGVVLFELLAGEPPFSANTPLELMQLVVSTPAPSLAAFNPDVPQPLVRLVDALLQKDPAARPASADAVRRALVAAAPPDHDGLWAIIDRPQAGPQPSVAKFTPDPLPALAQSPVPTPRPAPTRVTWAVAGMGVLTLGVVAALVLSALGEPPREVALPAEVVAPQPIARLPEPATPPAPPEHLVVLSDAAAALEAQALDRAQELYERCRVGGAPCPESAPALRRIQDERRYQALLNQASDAINAGQQKRALRLLAQARKTEVFKLRHQKLVEDANANVAPVTSRLPGAPEPQRTPLKIPLPGPTKGETTPYGAKFAEQLAVNQRCVDANPEAYECHYQLAEALLMKGESERAYAHWALFLEHAPKTDTRRATVQGMLGGTKYSSERPSE